MVSSAGLVRIRADAFFLRMVWITNIGILLHCTQIKFGPTVNYITSIIETPMSIDLNNDTFNLNQYTLKKPIILALALISICLNIKYLTNKFIYRPAKVIPATPTNAPTPYHLSRASEFEKLRIDTGDIVFLGNSLTDFFELSEFFGRTDIKNRGIAGDLTRDMLDRLAEITLGHPREVFIESGINDLLGGISVDSTFGNIELITASIKAISPRTEIIITSLLPTAWKITNTDRKVSLEIVALNEKLKGLAHADRLQYLDLYPDFREKDGLAKAYDCGDGLHLNGAGYLLWKNKLTPLLAPPPAR